MTDDGDPTTAATGSPPRPRTVVATRRRQRPLRIGIGLAVASLAGLLVGILLVNAVAAVAVVGADGRATVGEPITFSASAKQYDIVYLRGDVTDDFIDRVIASIDCTVAASDGTTRSVDGARQGVSSETDLGASIGSFEVPAGETVVLCEFTGTSQALVNRYAVAESGGVLEIVAWGVLGASILGGLAAAWLIVIGLRGTAVRVQRAD